MACYGAPGVAPLLGFSSAPSMVSFGRRLALLSVLLSTTLGRAATFVLYGDGLVAERVVSGDVVHRP